MWLKIFDLNEFHIINFNLQNFISIIFGIDLQSLQSFLINVSFICLYLFMI